MEYMRRRLGRLFFACDRRGAAFIEWSATKRKGRGGMKCWERWKLVGLCALALGVAILIAAFFPVGFLLFLAALLLIVCGIWLIQRR